MQAQTRAYSSFTPITLRIRTLRSVSDRSCPVEIGMVLVPASETISRVVVLILRLWFNENFPRTDTGEE